MLPDLVRIFLDYLIPPNSKHSIGGACTWRHSIDRLGIESFLYNFLTEEVSKNQASLENAHSKLFLKHRTFYNELADRLIEDYFNNEDLKKEFNQNIPAPMPKGYTLPATDWSILEPVVVNVDNALKFYKES